MKKLSLYFISAIAFISLTSIAQAQSTSDQQLFTGPYAGVNLGMMHFSSRAQSSGDDNVQDADADLGKNGFGSEINFGYGQALNSFYVGGEVFGRYSPTNLKMTADGNIGITEFKAKTSYGVAFKGGYFIVPKTLIYIVLGAENAKFSVTGTGDEVGESTSFSKKRWGFMPGVGIQIANFGHAMLDVKYTYTIFQKIQHTYDGNDSIEFTPRRSYIGAGITYTF